MMKYSVYIKPTPADQPATARSNLGLNPDRLAPIRVTVVADDHYADSNGNLVFLAGLKTTIAMFAVGQWQFFGTVEAEIRVDP